MADFENMTLVRPGRPGARFLIILAVIFTCFNSVAEQNENASKGVDELHEILLNIMQNADSLGYNGRFEKLEPIIESNFDTPLIVKVIMSRYWKEISEEDKSTFIELFKHLTIATYASRFNAFDGEVFAEINQEDLKKERVLIKTELRKKNGDSVRLDYLMHRVDNNWLIISVIANGVNDLSLKRAEYAAVIKEKGFEGLVHDIQGKIDAMENDPGD